MTDINDTKIAKLIEDNRGIFDLLVGEGHSGKEAIRQVTELAEEREEHLKFVEGIRVPKEILMSELTKHFPTLLSLGRAEINRTLFSLGFDTQKKSPSVFKRLTRDESSPKLEMKSYLIGEERLDKGWVTKTYPDGSYVASYEAREEHKNRRDPTRIGHMKELFGND